MKYKEIATLLKTIADSFLALSEIYSSAEDDFPPMKESPSVAAESSTEEEPTPETEPESKSYTKEEVRGVLSAKANAENGKFKAAVKDIVKKYGNGGSLTNVDAKDYAALVADVEALA